MGEQWEPNPDYPRQRNMLIGATMLLFVFLGVLYAIGQIDPAQRKQGEEMRANEVQFIESHYNTKMTTEQWSPMRPMVGLLIGLIGFLIWVKSEGGTAWLIGFPMALGGLTMLIT